MKKQAAIIKQTVGSEYMKGVCVEKGWSMQHAAYMVTEYLNSKGLSLVEFMERQPVAAVDGHVLVSAKTRRGVSC